MKPATPECNLAVLKRLKRFSRLTHKYEELDWRKKLMLFVKCVQRVRETSIRQSTHIQLYSFDRCSVLVSVFLFENVMEENSH